MKKIVLVILSIICLLSFCCLGACNNGKVYYSITFTQENEENIVKRVEKGTSLTDVPTPTQKTGYEVNWSVTDFNNVQSDMIIEAVYTAKTYTIYLQSDIDFEGSKEIKVKFNEIPELPTPVSMEKEFHKWMNEDGSDYVLSKYNIDGDLTLKAKWGNVGWFGQADGAYVRIGLDDENNPIIDEGLNGIKFVSKIDATEYEKLSAKGVKFGILLMPYDYIADKDTVNEDLFFGENREFYFSDDEAFAGGKKIINVVTDKLAENGDGDFYYSASIVGIEIENKDKEFVAISYVLTTNEYGQIEYDLKDYSKENNVRSMSYVAQKIVESNDSVYTNDIKNALVAYYITGVDNTIDVNFKVSYGGTSVDFTEELTVELSTELSANDMVVLLKEKGVFDTSLYTYSNAIIKQNGKSVDKIKVYANDNTKEDVMLNFVAKEVNSLDTIKGYYTANGTELVLKGNGFATLNNQKATYKYFADGKVVVTQSGNVKVGTLDNETGVLTINDGEEGISLLNSMYLSDSATKELLGCYKTSAGLFIELKDDGEMVYDKCGFINQEENGSWVVYYDKSAETFKIVLFASSVQFAREFSLNANTLTVGNDTFSKVEVGTKEDYKTFANTYVAMRTYTGGENAIESRLTFTEEGDVFYLDPYAESSSLTIYESMGKYIILSNGQIQLKLKQKANNTIVTASYTTAQDKNTVTITLNGKAYTYESVHVSDENVYTALSGKKYYGNSNNGSIDNFGAYYTFYSDENVTNKSAVTGWKRLTINGSFKWVSHASNSYTAEAAYKIQRVTNYMGYITYYWGDGDKYKYEYYEGCYQLVDGKYQIYMATSPSGKESKPAGMGLFSQSEGTSGFKLGYIISDIARLMNANSVATESTEKAKVMTMADVAGNYKVTNMYGKDTTFDTNNWYAAFRFYDDGRLYYNGDSSYGRYSLKTSEDNPNLAEVKFDIAYDQWMTGYFVRIDGEIILRLRTGNLGIFNQNWLDYKKDGTKFSTWDVFSALAGDGSGEDGTKKVYISADNKARLELQNDGVFAKVMLPHLDAKTKHYYGAECKLIINGKTYCARYDLLPLSATVGKMRVNVYGTELNVADESVANKDFWADYELVDKSYVITFTFDDVDYVLSVAGSNYVQNMIAGIYVGNNKLVLYSTSLADYGTEIDLDYTVIPKTVNTGKITILHNIPF